MGKKPSINDYDWKDFGCLEEFEYWRKNAIAQLETELEQRPSIKVSDGDIWLVFDDTMISIEGLCKSGTPGPIVRRNLRKWRDNVIASLQRDKPK